MTMYIQTLAVKITPKTYSLAVASLPPVFTLFPHESVMGSYLVLNQVEVKFGKRNKQKLTLGNSWMSEETFRSTFKFVRQENVSVPAEVRRIDS